MFKKKLFSNEYLELTASYLSIRQLFKFYRMPVSSVVDRKTCVRFSGNDGCKHHSGRFQQLLIISSLNKQHKCL